MILITANEQRQIEQAAVERNTELLTLMERAGKAVFLDIEERFRKRLRNICCVVLCGNGGNGGDGFVTARYLRESGADVCAVLVCGAPKTDDAKTMYEKAVGAGVVTVDAELNFALAIQKLENAAVIADAVYGIGFHGGFDEKTSEIFKTANSSEKAYRVAADVPSGIGSDSGTVCENAFCAHKTVAMVGTKAAHILKSSLSYCGEVYEANIGLPNEAYSDVGQTMGIITHELAARLLPRRDDRAHKGTYGRLTLVAGSDRYRGAAVLCAKGGLAGGAGLVYVASGEKTLEAVAAHCPEAVLVDVKLESKAFVDTLAVSEAAVIGCGLSVINSTRGLLDLTMKSVHCPLIIDADGINIIAEDINILKGHKSPIVITPHIGEFARLIGSSTEQVLANRLELARSFAAQYDVTVVLKSDNTVVAFPSGEVFVCTIGNSGLAKGGSGDLLSGLIGSLAAMGIQPGFAALLGVYIHSRAADIAAKQIPKHCMTASLVAEFIPCVYEELSQDN